MNQIEKNLLKEIADLHEIPVGAYNIRTNEKYEQAYEIAGFALDCAIKACEMWGIEYTIGTKEMTRG